MIITLGDVHGRFRKLKSEIHKYDISDCTLIQVGDFGVGFLDSESEYEKLKSLDEVLKTRNIKMYVIRGNHDIPHYFLDSLKTDSIKNYLSQFNNITFVDDWNVINIENYNILFIGGAISLDRDFRDENVGWWPDEKVQLLSFKDYDLPKVDGVISHTSPLNFPFVQVTIDFLKKFSYDAHSLKKDMDRERNFLQYVYEWLIDTGNEPSFWMYGHFHKNSDIYIRNTRAVCLGELSFMMLSS